MADTIPPTPANITGLILAGGQATRFQRVGEPWADKGLALLKGRPLASYVHDYLAPRVAQVWVSANRNAEAYAAYGNVVADDPVYGPDAGPLAGVASALVGVQTPWMLVLPADTPCVPAHWADRLADEAIRHAVLLVSARTPSQSFPLCMLVHRSLAASLRAYLLGGDRKVRLWQQQAGGYEVSFDAHEREFLNINTPESLAQADRGYQA